VVDGSSRLSRRDLLAVSGAAGAALALAGCENVTASTNPTLSKLALKATPSDVPILNGLLELEYLSAYAYTAATPLLNRADSRTTRQFLHFELAHITVLRTLIDNAHGKAVPQRSTYRLGHARGPRELLSVLRRIEEESIRRYLSAIPRLSHGGVRGVAASIMGNEGQHLSVLRESLGLEPVPAALVTAAE
jgi:hypothetical protein